MIAKFYTDNDAKPTLISCEKCKNMCEHEVTYETQKQRRFGAISINITDWYLNHVDCRVTYWNNYYKYDYEGVDIKERSEYIEFTFPKNHFTLLQAITYMKKYFYMNNHEYANRDWEVRYTSSEEAL